MLPEGSTLYLINTIFISLATVIGVHIMHFKKKEFQDPKRENRVKQIIASIAVLTMVPASFLTYHMVRETVFEKKASNFIANELESDTTRVVTRDIRYKEKTIQVVLLGQEVNQDRIKDIHKLEQKYGLEEVKLSIVQGGSNLNSKEIQSMLKGNAQLISAELQLEQEKQIRTRNRGPEKTMVTGSKELTQSAQGIQQECRGLFPRSEQRAPGLRHQYPH